MTITDMPYHNAPFAQPAFSNPPKLGAHLIADGVDIAVEAPHASSVWACFVDPESATEHCVALHRGMYGIWSGYVEGIHAGQLYGIRADGRWDPPAGHVYNPAKLLLDPYARAVGRSPQLHPALYGYVVDDDGTPHPTERDEHDSIAYGPLGVILPDTPAPTTRPQIPWDETVIYEAHVVGLTKTLPGLPDELRGTYAGLGHPVTIDYLTSLGITAIELLPIHAKMSEPFLTRKGLENYWGYNTLGFFAPEPSYATESSQQAGGQAVVNEVKDMVAALHAAGIEVLLDVVYNHSCEAGTDGVTVSWRGLDSSLYYRHDSANPGALKDTTGCGNSFDFRRSSVIRMTLDSLRYWVEVIGVDGFRFDLAVTLGREGDSFNPNHPLYIAMATDPVLSTVKLINEPWDVGYGGWRTGQFPVPTADWNDRFRDTLRSFWLSEPAAIMHGGHGSDLRDLATRMAGSADLFGHGRIPGGRGVHASINFVTAHDGFSLNDLTAYSHKHNDANLEDNRDGSDNNLSWNHGVEGTAPENISAMRRKSARNLMACLVLAAGTPMLTAGDEILKTQHGNNNAYCQNSPLSWLNWDLGEDEANMLATTSFLLQLRREHAVFRPTQFFTGSPREGDALRDMEWLDASGNQMQDYTWFDPQARLVQMLRSGRGMSRDALVIINGQAQAEQVTLPWGRGTDFELMWASQWERPREHTEHIAPGGHLTLAPFSVAVLLGGSAER
ncbi:glycogen debranching protein GlgX [Arcanobacterium phocae]|uniref:glycogen debranching protein GlgX n=1 Tax=Arcanobacterium phocae TaxID=131112 RepID=UPI00344B99CE